MDENSKSDVNCQMGCKSLMRKPFKFEVIRRRLSASVPVNIVRLNAGA